MVDAQGEMNVDEIAPVLGNLDVLDIRMREFAVLRLRSVPPPHIDAVVILRFLVTLTGGEKLQGVGLIEGVVDFLLALVRVAAPGCARAVVLDRKSVV